MLRNVSFLPVRVLANIMKVYFLPVMVLANLMRVIIADLIKVRFHISRVLELANMMRVLAIV